jgi:hypothetical protein
MSLRLLRERVQLASLVMPWALLVHLGFAIWMYGDPETLVSGPVKVGNKEWEREYQDAISGRKQLDSIGLGKRLGRANVFPLAVLFFLIVLHKLIVTFVAGPIIALIKYDACVAVAAVLALGPRWGGCVPLLVASRAVGGVPALVHRGST